MKKRERKTVHEGHRQRIIEKLESPEVLQDHELLEILLFNAIPRKNTNPIAHTLLDKFGTLWGVLHATVDQLAQVEGVGVSTGAYLRTVGVLYDRIGNNFDRVRVDNFNEFVSYLSQKYAGRTEEVIEIYCLDKKDLIIGLETFSSGLEDETSLPLCALAQIFSSYKPASILFVHNHPKAEAVPSRDDDLATARIYLECRLNGVNMFDHIIMGKDGTSYSYRGDGKLLELHDGLDPDKLVRKNGIKRY